jgi:hypothetical protein
VAALEAAVRRLAFTLTSPEFRDLDGRRTRAERVLAELERRLALATDDAELAAIGRAMDPAALAPFSLRAVREDLRRVDEATWAVIRALGGGEVTASAATSVAIDDTRGEAAVETRYQVEAPLTTRIHRLDPGVLRQSASAGPGLPRVSLETAGSSARDVTGGGDVLLDPGVARLVLVTRRVEPLLLAATQAPLRRIAFSHLLLPTGPGSGGRSPTGHLLVGVRPAGTPGAEALLAVALPAPGVAEVVSPSRSLFWVGAAGLVTSSEGRDVWRPASIGRVPLPLPVELAPRGWLFRNRAFAVLAPYLYRPNPAALLGLVGLAALTVALIGPRRQADGEEVPCDCR